MLFGKKKVNKNMRELELKIESMQKDMEKIEKISNGLNEMNLIMLSEMIKQENKIHELQFGRARA